MKTGRTYIPALRFHWLTPIYDPILRWLMQEEHFKQALIQEANIHPGQKVLDLGCGTATLTVMMKQAHPQAVIIGLDGDPQVLSVGRAKAAQASVPLILDQGMAYHLPYSDASFDRVVSSLMFHHLNRQDKQLALQETYRVLKPGGALLIVDFGPPARLWSRLISPLMARLEEVGDHHQGLLPGMIRLAAFNEVDVIRTFETVFGTLNLYVCQK